MQTVVGVLRGGPSRVHDISLASGAHMLANLPEEQYSARDIYIDREGNWYDRGRPTAPERILRQIDVALVGLHGEYGEDGGVQKLLERFGVPYAGSSSYGSYLSAHALLAKMHAREAGLLTPEFKYIENKPDEEAAVHEIIRTFHQPVAVKSDGWRLSGTIIAGGYSPVLSAVNRFFDEGARSVMVEEYIRGQDAVVGIIDGMRGEKFYALPAVAKGTYKFSRVIQEELQRIARMMHRVLGLRHYSESSFIVADKGVYYLSTRSQPILAPEHSFVKALSAVGISLKDFLKHLIAGARS